MVFIFVSVFHAAKGLQLHFAVSSKVRLSLSSVATTNWGPHKTSS